MRGVNPTYKLKASGVILPFPLLRITSKRGTILIIYLHPLIVAPLPAITEQHLERELGAPTRQAPAARVKKTDTNRGSSLKAQGQIPSAPGRKN